MDIVDFQNCSFVHNNRLVAQYCRFGPQILIALNCNLCRPIHFNLAVAACCESPRRVLVGKVVGVIICAKRRAIKLFFFPAGFVKRYEIFLVLKLCLYMPLFLRVEEDECPGCSYHFDR